VLHQGGLAVCESERTTEGHGIEAVPGSKAVIALPGL
jgi:hypothetical protein